MTDVESWGRYPKVEHKGVIPFTWRHGNLPEPNGVPFLPFGLGRSYGDVCLNEGGWLLQTTSLDRLISFDYNTGLLTCEAGVSLAQVIDAFLPHGWFLPVSPGTKFVTVGGAIANDVHGKNHHAAGTFGNHVTQLELLRSNGERLLCSPKENTDMFCATIGGMGLTGLITWATVQLKKVQSPFIHSTSIKFKSLDEFFELSALAEQKSEYVVSWLDTTATGKKNGRGILMHGHHANPFELSLPKLKAVKQKPFPMDAPKFLLNPLSIRAFNMVYYRRLFRKLSQKIVHYEPYFYPLDAILNWNRMYGKRGLLQYQCVVPYDNNANGIREIIRLIGMSGQASFLAVLKTFGNSPAAGMMSFPKVGVTLALDFPNNGEKTYKLFRELDAIVRAEGGRLYSAKDSRMDADFFKESYPNWRDFSTYIDPAFSSSFWRRVTA